MTLQKVIKSYYYFTIKHGTWSFERPKVSDQKKSLKCQYVKMSMCYVYEPTQKVHLMLRDPVYLKKRSLSTNSGGNSVENKGHSIVDITLFLTISVV